jgi:hypothetical protein
MFLPSFIKQPSYSQGYARNAGESIAPGLWDGLVGAWVPFLGPTGFTLYDIGYLKNHGTLTNMETSDWIICDRNYAISLGGTDEFVSLGTGFANFLKTDSFSIYILLKSSTDATMAFFSNWDVGSSGGWHLFSNVTTGVIDWMIGDSSGPRLRRAGNTNVLDGELHSIIGTYDGSVTRAGLNIYVDGAIESYTEKEDIDPGVLGDGDVNLGQRPDGTGHYTGEILAAFIYKKELNAIESLELHNNVKEMFIPRWQFDALGLMQTDHLLLLDEGQLNGQLQELGGGF